MQATIEGFACILREYWHIHVKSVDKKRRGG